MESVFSAVKRKFGENTVSKAEKTLRAEAVQRFWSYDTLKNYGIYKVGCGLDFSEDDERS